jgi:tetratricopeptide (TPR) repeat protein
MNITKLSRYLLALSGLLVAITTTPAVSGAVISIEAPRSHSAGAPGKNFLTLATSQGATDDRPATTAPTETVLALMPNFAAAVRKRESGNALDILSDPSSLRFENATAFSDLVSAQRAFDEGDYNKAIAFAREALKTDSGEARAHFMIGSSMLALGRKKEASEALSRALRIESDYPEAMSNLAVLLYQDGEVDEAILLLVHALESNVGYISAWQNYLSMIAREMIPEKNLADLPSPPAEDIEEQFTPARWHWRQAIDAMDARDGQLAARHFLRSLSLNINDPNTHNDFAVFLQRIDRRLFALPFLRAAAHLSPDAPLVRENLENLARGLELESQQKQVQRLRDKIAKQDTAVDRLALARLLGKLEADSVEIIDQLIKAVALEPDDISYQLELIETLDRAQLQQDAIEILRPILAADPENPRWHVRMARMLMQQSDPSAADLAQAVDNARRACELTQYSRKDALSLLAELFELTGDEDKASAVRERLQEL